jgi:hypothetical protein
MTVWLLQRELLREGSGMHAPPDDLEGNLNSVMTHVLER